MTPISKRAALVMGWLGIAFSWAECIRWAIQLWEPSWPAHPMALLALIVGSAALLRTTEGGGENG